MAVSDLVNLSGLMDDAKCFAFVRQRRWPEGIRCPACDNGAVIRDGHDDTQPFRRLRQGSRHKHLPVVFRERRLVRQLPRWPTRSQFGEGSAACDGRRGCAGCGRDGDAGSGAARHGLGRTGRLTLDT